LTVESCLIGKSWGIWRRQVLLRQVEDSLLLWDLFQQVEDLLLIV